MCAAVRRPKEAVRSATRPLADPSERTPFEPDATPPTFRIPPMTSLRQAISRSLIVCFREDVDQLERALAAADLHPQVLRASHTAKELTFPATTRCFLSHRRAWQIA